MAASAEARWGRPCLGSGGPECPRSPYAGTAPRGVRRGRQLQSEGRRSGRQAAAGGDRRDPAHGEAAGDYIWISGYWAWEAERDNYIWISGVWRLPPPGTTWLPGYWSQATTGYQWISGYWGPATVAATGRRSRPSICRSRSKSLDWDRSASARRPLFLGPGVLAMGGGPLRCGGPGVGRWPTVIGFGSPTITSGTPAGYVFIAGHWDYRLGPARHSLLPGLLRQPYYAAGATTSSPTICIEAGVLHGYLFCRPAYGHYYFGDYYDPAYVSVGFYPVVRRPRRLRAVLRPRSLVLPARSDVGPADARGLQYRRDHVEARPPHTYALAVRGTGAGRGEGQLRHASVAHGRRRPWAMHFEHVSRSGAADGEDAAGSPPGPGGAADMEVGPTGTGASRHQTSALAMPNSAGASLRRSDRKPSPGTIRRQRRPARGPANGYKPAGTTPGHAARGASAARPTRRRPPQKEDAQR